MLFRSHSTPAVTTVAVPFAELGAAAVDELLAARDEQKELAGQILDPAPVILEVSLVTRATTARARTR